MPLGELDDADLTALHETVCFASQNEDEFVEFLESREYEEIAERFREESTAGGNELVGRVYRVLCETLRLEV